MVKNKIIVPLLANAILLTACETAETITLKYIDPTLSACADVIECI